MINRRYKPAFLLLMLFSYACPAQRKTTAQQNGTLRISFVNIVNGVPLVLNDAEYTNPFHEKYRIGKLKYYVSNVEAQNKRGIQKERNSYHLLNAADEQTMRFSFSLRSGSYDTLSFLLGVDSLRNCSGAQTGALDPLNDMFWTWNSGYVMFKMEGSSPASDQIGNRFEYHIGGYSGPNSAIRKIRIAQTFEILAGKTTELIVESDIGKFWQDPNDIPIALTPVCTTPGTLSKRIADNCSKMFRIKNQYPDK
jgi:hypothetical protein